MPPLHFIVGAVIDRPRAIRESPLLLVLRKDCTPSLIRQKSVIFDTFPPGEGFYSVTGLPPTKTAVIWILSSKTAMSGR